MGNKQSRKAKNKKPKKKGEKEHRFEKELKINQETNGQGIEKELKINNKTNKQGIEEESKINKEINEISFEKEPKINNGANGHFIEKEPKINYLINENDIEKEQNINKGKSLIKCTYEIKDFNEIQIINNGLGDSVNKDIKNKIKILNDDRKENLIYKKKFDKLGLNVIYFIIEEKLNDLSFIFSDCLSLKKIKFII